MKNVTVSLEEDLLAWARAEAGRRGGSVSRLFADLAEDARRSDPTYQAAMTDFFSRGATDLGFDGAAPSRETLYDRQDVRGHESVGLHEGSQRPFEAK
jgi:hypothetical protein